MKKILYGVLAIIIILECYIIGYKLKPYSQKDKDRVVDIYLEKIKPTILDYYRLDVNKDSKITLYDGVLIIKNV